uniref:Extramacrochaetae protein n=1 Tax=Bemisia tabaci TaxID=7038 RepID=A0A3R5SQ59_BEMTA|nr:extramacrochaetae protein [Bemisia tabaci]
MKAVAISASESSGVINGRVHKPRRDLENEEIQMYLSKLKELVPFMPKNRRLSKLEVIQNVIEYICDLQNALENHPNMTSEMVQSAAAVALSPVTTNSRTSSANRQPLGVLAPNVIVSNTCSSVDQTNAPVSHPLEKTSTPSERHVSC